MINKIKIFTIFLTFALTVLFHFMNDIFDIEIFNSIFPVNESIFEHMKLFFYGILTASLIEFILFKIFNIETNNFIFASAVSSIISIFIFLIMYFPINLFIEEFLPLTLLLMIITLTITFNIKYRLYFLDETIVTKILGVILILIFINIFHYFTYNPIKIDFFKDSSDNSYGIKK